MSLSACFGEPPTRFGQKSPRKSVLKSAYTRSGKKVNCYESGRGRFCPSCDISATNCRGPNQVRQRIRKNSYCQFVGRTLRLSLTSLVDAMYPPTRGVFRQGPCLIAAQPKSISQADRFLLAPQPVAPLARDRTPRKSAARGSLPSASATRSGYDRLDLVTGFAPVKEMSRDSRLLLSERH